MIERRYQYLASGGEIKWTKWFTYRTSETLNELKKIKPYFKKLKEEYREI